MAVAAYTPVPDSTPWAKLTADQQWTRLAQNQGKYAKSVLKGRPAPNAAPATIFAWLKQAKLSPVFAYPEFGWTVSGANATAGYDLGSNDTVTWTADSSGNNDYDHVTGGLSFGNFLNDTVTALAGLASVEGLVFLGMFISTLQAVANHEPIGQLGTSLKADWDKFANSAQLAFSVIDGDWAQTWNYATQYGKDLTGIAEAWYPGPAPDINGKLTITKATAAAPTTATKAQPMATKVTWSVPQPVAAAIAKVAPASTIGQLYLGTGTAQAVAPKPPAAAPAAVPWYSKPLVGPVTVGEAGIGAAVLGVLAKVVLK
jgi:hypothetical protein